jgi:hypothetical protein
VPSQFMLSQRTYDGALQPAKTPAATSDRGFC